MENEPLELLPLNLRALPQLAFGDFMDLQQAAITAFIKGAGQTLITPEFTLARLAFFAANGGFSGGLVFVAGHEATPMLKADDKLRDDAYVDFWAFFGIKKKKTDEATKIAVTKLSHVKKTYAGLTKLAYGAETKGMYAFLALMKSPAYEAPIGTLELMPYVDAIAAAQQKFDATFNYRWSDQAAQAVQETPKNEALRKALQTEYAFLVSYVEFMVHHCPQSAWRELLVVLNISRALYASKLASKKKEELIASN